MKRMEFFIEILQKTVSITPEKPRRAAAFADKAENVVTVPESLGILLTLVNFDVAFVIDCFDSLIGNRMADELDPSTGFRIKSSLFQDDGQVEDSFFG